MAPPHPPLPTAPGWAELYAHVHATALTPHKICNAAPLPFIFLSATLHTRCRDTHFDPAPGSRFPVLHGLAMAWKEGGCTETALTHLSCLGLSLGPRQLRRLQQQQAEGRGLATVRTVLHPRPTQPTSLFIDQLLRHKVIQGLNNPGPQEQAWTVVAALTPHLAPTSTTLLRTTKAWPQTLATVPGGAVTEAVCREVGLPGIGAEIGRRAARAAGDLAAWLLRLPLEFRCSPPGHRIQSASGVARQRLVGTPLDLVAGNPGEVGGVEGVLDQVAQALEEAEAPPTILLLDQGLWSRAVIHSWGRDLQAHPRYWALPGVWHLAYHAMGLLFRAEPHAHALRAIWAAHPRLCQKHYPNNPSAGLMCQVMWAVVLAFPGAEAGHTARLAAGGNPDNVVHMLGILRDLASIYFPAVCPAPESKGCQATLFGKGKFWA